LKELSDACRRQGMTMCWYHSIMDWHHPDYLPRREWESRPAAGADFDRYVTYLRAQVTELLTNYGDIGVMWFDGEWENTWSHKYGKALYELCRKLQPRVIVNNRVDVGRGGMAGMTSEGEYAGDFGTPEQEIPSTGMAGLDWETCMTMNDHWGYNRADINFKSTEDLIRKLCDIASKGGNFLLNVGPTAEGKIPETSVARLREIGDWMRVNGESIYNTSASPFPQLGFGRCTMKRDGAKTILYFHVFDWPRDGMLMIPGIGNKPIGARVVGAAEALQVERVDSDLRIRVPGSAPSKICSVVALEVEGAPIVYVAPEIAAPSDQFVDSIEVALKVPTQQLQVRYSLDGTDPAHGAWIYEKPVVVSKTSTLKARAFHDGKAVSGISEMRLEKVEPAKAREIAPAALNPGVVSERFDGDWSRVPDFTKLTAASKVVAPAPRIEAGDGERMARRIVGFVVAPADDVYRFALESDDGSKLYINDVLIVDNDGLHPMDTKFGRAALARGLHSIRVEYFNKTGGKGLSVKWARLGAQLEALTDESLKHEIAAER
jgi:alpha-L-fucosidase